MWLKWPLMEEAKGGDAGGAGGTAAAATGAGGAAAASGASAAAGGAPAEAGAVNAGAASGEAKPFWPEGWQKQIAGDDEKELKQLQRYGSPIDIWKKARSLEQRMSSGELRASLPKDAKPEELAAWRKDNGIPEKPEDYDLKFDSGLVIGDEDKESISGFLKTAHDANLSPQQAKNAIEWYYKEQERQTQVRAEQDDAQRNEALDAIAQEWGHDARRNLTVIENVLSMFPKDVADELKASRLPNGKGLFNDMRILKAFHMLGVELNPAAALMPAGTANQPQAVEDRIKEIEALMKKDRPAYNKDEAMQAELRTLYEARDRINAKKAA